MKRTSRTMGRSSGERGRHRLESTLRHLLVRSRRQPRPCRPALNVRSRPAEPARVLTTRTATAAVRDPAIARLIAAGGNLRGLCSSCVHRDGPPRLRTIRQHGNSAEADSQSGGVLQVPVVRDEGHQVQIRDRDDEHRTSFAGELLQRLGPSDGSGVSAQLTIPCARSFIHIRSSRVADSDFRPDGGPLDRPVATPAAWAV